LAGNERSCFMNELTKQRN